jgi:hypothetical protein
MKVQVKTLETIRNQAKICHQSTLTIKIQWENSTSPLHNRENFKLSRRQHVSVLFQEPPNCTDLDLKMHNHMLTESDFPPRMT